MSVPCSVLSSSILSVETLECCELVWKYLIQMSGIIFLLRVIVGNSIPFGSHISSLCFAAGCNISCLVRNGRDRQVSSGRI